MTLYTNVIIRIINDDVHSILRSACSNDILHTLVAFDSMPMTEGKEKMKASGQEIIHDSFKGKKFAINFAPFSVRVSLSKIKNHNFNSRK
jgi:hypothetical protein